MVEIDSKDFSEIQAQWATVRGRIRQKIGDAQFKSWIKIISLKECIDGKIILSVPSAFIRTRIIEQYLDIIKSYWLVQNLKVNDIEIVVIEDNKNKISEKSSSENKKAEIKNKDNYKQDDIFNSISSDLDTRFTFSNFIVGKPNELAFAAARRVAESNDVPFNPLFLYGGVGLGKTHLMHAISHEIKERKPLRRVIYMSAEKFMYYFIKALRFKNTVAFKEQFRNVDVLMIDDVQFISGKDSTQEEFFHTFNSLLDMNKKVIISGDRPPSDLGSFNERMKSRLSGGLVVDIMPADYNLRFSIIKNKYNELKDRNKNTLSLDEEVLSFLAKTVTSNVRELEGALNKVYTFSNILGKKIDVELTKSVLKDLLKSNDKRITIDEIQKKVSSYYNIRIDDLISSRRIRTFARPRQIAMYLSKKLTTRSLPEIGRKFGGRDHTTVIHAVKKIDELKENDSKFDEDVNLITQMITSL